jgi:hypothetical protein
MIATQEGMPYAELLATIIASALDRAAPVGLNTVRPVSEPRTAPGPRGPERVLRHA